MVELVIRIVGTPGDGIISSGDILTLAAARSGRYVSTYRSFPTEIRGEDQSLYQLRISSKKILTSADEIDILIAFNEKFLRDNIADLKKGGAVIFDSSINDEKFKEYKNITKYFVPIANLAKEFATERSKNMVALGILLGLAPNFEINEQIKSDIQKKYETKDRQIVENNVQAFEKAYIWARQNLEKEAFLEKLVIEPSGKKLIMSGCEAMALGALVAGCKFYSGYPITPATEIMEFLAKELPRLGGNVLQCEDEIAAITAALGASFSGVKAMTATSGPGLSLMSEAIGLASMAELPVVIADVQRGGPSTGLPTKTEQSDLNLAIYGTHGDTPKIVLAPINVEDSFYQTVKAFNYAEKYQVPVIILSDVSLGERRECIDEFDIKDIEVINRLKPEKLNENESFSRYTQTYSGISPMTTPGEKGGAYIATGLEHTEDSSPSSKPHVHAAMTEKRFKKIETAQSEFLAAKTYGDDDAKFGIISWGSTSGAVLEAIDLAEKQGYKIQALYPRIIYPFPTKWINDFLHNKEMLLIVERNYCGQFANTIVYRCTCLNKDIKIHNLMKYNGEPFTTKEIFNKIDQIIKGQYLKFMTHQH
ncbi:MAG TPA: 2-oxoacid:acceptor oxidoreductase subunit alpha [Candidatus Gastranaerophilales bacterium]|nr:2-oxoacid:acceptor oxidoreductase subunit alpha [Candidatus Gastranaerophilales bacterium]